MNKNVLKTISLDALTEYFEDVFKNNPELRPDPEMHDYQLTYPPAVQIEKNDNLFFPSEEQYIKKAKGKLKNTALYFHFGFCQYKCRYCHHYEIKTNTKDDAISKYVESMCLEMDKFKAITKTLKPLIYFLGGGTPTMLPDKVLEKFLVHLNSTFGKPAASLSTVEVKPITATEKKLKLLRKHGFKRINLGVQTLDPELYKFHHHGEELEVSFEAIKLARRCGYEYINIDILMGIENQTNESWNTSLKKISELIVNKEIDSVFIYPYHDDPRSKTFNNDVLPTVFDTIYCDALARKLFQSFGWKELGTRFYRSPRHVRAELFDWARIRFNPGYGEFLYHGFGNSAFSVGDSSSYINTRKIKDYCENVNNNGLAISHWIELDDYQRATRDITFDLLYSPFVRVRGITKKYGKHTMEVHVETLNKWTKLGFGSWNKFWGIWRLSDYGKLIHQELLKNMYLPKEKTKQNLIMQERIQAGRLYRGY